MNKLKLMTIVGTRPEIIRLSEIIKLADNLFDHILVHTGQNWDYTLNEIFFQDLNLRQPNFYLNAAKDCLGDTLGEIISQSYNILLKEKPDALLILGDTNSALCAICAKRLKIPVFHMEAGNRCFDQNLPEEINRRLIDHISDVNLPYTEHARRNLIFEGLKAEFTFVTGSPLTEVINSNIAKINSSNILSTLSLSKDNYFVLSMHREENISNTSNFENLIKSANLISETYDLPIIFSTHPRTAKKLKETNYTLHPNISTVPPLSFTDYVHLQQNAFCTLSDSGTLAEESSLLHFPAISLRTSSERPESLDKGSMIIGGISPESIINSINIIKSTYYSSPNDPPFDYQDSSISTKIVSLIQSYTPIVNSKIWNKH